MKTRIILIFFFSFYISSAFSQSFRPSNPNASREAIALTELFYNLSGRYTLTGQHNYPATKDRNSRFAAGYEGQTPAIWSTDMGFAKEGDTDSYLARPDIVREAIRQHKNGSIVTICWHAVPPTADEPVTFQPRGRVSPDSLASVQGKLPEYQFRDILTPGTRLHNRWAAQVDSVARYLKMLEEAKVPVLWRPYHEMNGDWFWWGGRVGEYSTIDLYKQLYDRLVNHHKLTNLVWVWNIDRPSTPVRKFSNFYPGDAYLDILSLDVYGADFNQAYYDSLVALSKGKPILFGEVGNPPSLEILKAQPKWTSWVIWSGFVRNTAKDQFKEFRESERVLYQEDAAYWQVMKPFRNTCGLPDLPIQNNNPLDFSGNWILNEEKSSFGNSGRGNSADKMYIRQYPDLLAVRKYTVVEWGEDRVTNEEIYLDGSPMVTRTFNSRGTSGVSWDTSDGNRMIITSSTKFEREGRTFEMKSSETWTLEGNGKILKIAGTSTGFRGETVATTRVYDLTECL